MNDTTTISVPAPKLRLMLTAVLPHCGDGDDTLPQIRGVRFDYQAGVLYLVATDRYTLGVARESMPEAAAAAIPEQAATLPLDDAWELRRILKKRDEKAVIRIGDGKITVSAGDVSGSWTAVAPGTYSQGKTGFPEWRKTLHGALTGTQVPMGEKAGADAEKLARLTPGAARAREPLNVRLLVPADSLATIPMLVATAGDWFIAALMLVRLGGAETRVGTDWDSWAAATAPAAAPEPEQGDVKVPEPAEAAHG